MSAESYFEVQVQQAEENAEIGDLVDRVVQIREIAKRYYERLEQTCANRAAKGQRLSRINVECFDWAGEELEKAAAATDQLLRAIQEDRR
jgi:hypothetical protein